MLIKEQKYGFYLKHFKNILFFVIFLFFSLNSFSQSVGDLRSRQSGNWSDQNCWERWNGTTWQNGGSGTPNTSTENAEILPNHTITINSNTQCKCKNLVNNGIARFVGNNRSLFVYGDLTGTGTILYMSSALTGTNKQILYLYGAINQNTIADMETRYQFVYYLGNIDQTVIPANYTVLRLEGTGNKILTGDVNIIDTLGVLCSDTLVCDTSQIYGYSNAVLYVKPNVIMTLGDESIDKNITFPTGFKTIILDTTSLVIYQSLGKQTVSGIDYGNLMLKGGAKIAESNIKVYDNLNLNTTLNLNDNMITMGVNGNITYDDIDSRIIFTQKSTILKEYNKAENVLFPIGTDTVYTPMEVDINSITFVNGYGQLFIKCVNDYEPNHSYDIYSLKKYWKTEYENINTIDVDFKFKFSKQEVYQDSFPHYIGAQLRSDFVWVLDGIVDTTTRTITFNRTDPKDIFGYWTAGVDANYRCFQWRTVAEGNVDQNWCNPNNWIPIGVPDSNTCVIIQNTFSWGVAPNIISSCANSMCNSIILTNNGRITLSSANALHIYGSFIRYNSNSVVGSVEFKGSKSAEIYARNNFYNSVPAYSEDFESDVSEWTFESVPNHSEWRVHNDGAGADTAFSGNKFATIYNLFNDVPYDLCDNCDKTYIDMFTTLDLTMYDSAYVSFNWKNNTRYNDGNYGSFFINHYIMKDHLNDNNTWQSTGNLDISQFCNIDDNVLRFRFFLAPTTRKPGLCIDNLFVYAKLTRLDLRDFIVSKTGDANLSLLTPISISNSFTVNSGVVNMGRYIHRFFNTNIVKNGGTFNADSSTILYRTSVLRNINVNGKLAFFNFKLIKSGELRINGLNVSKMDSFMVMNNFIWEKTGMDSIIIGKTAQTYLSLPSSIILDENSKLGLKNNSILEFTGNFINDNGTIEANQSKVIMNGTSDNFMFKAPADTIFFSDFENANDTIGWHLENTSYSNNARLQWAWMRGSPYSGTYNIGVMDFIGGQKWWYDYPWDPVCNGRTEKVIDLTNYPCAFLEFQWKCGGSAPKPGVYTGDYGFVMVNSDTILNYMHSTIDWTKQYPLDLTKYCGAPITLKFGFKGDGQWADEGTLCSPGLCIDDILILTTTSYFEKFDSLVIQNVDTQYTTYIQPNLKITSDMLLNNGTVFMGNQYTDIQKSLIIGTGWVKYSKSKFIFSSSNNSTLKSKFAPSYFHQIDLVKSDSTKTLTMDIDSIYLIDTLFMTKGNIELNNGIIKLDSTGYVFNERNYNQISDFSGGDGYLETFIRLNGINTTYSNIRGLGLTLKTSTTLPDSTYIRRGHKFQMGGDLIDTSGLRYFLISPLNNVGLNMAMQYKFFDNEVSTMEKTKLDLYRAVPPYTNYVLVKVDSASAIFNTIYIDSINSFSKWTPYTPEAPLMLKFINFDCNISNSNFISWSLISDNNSNMLSLEKSSDGLVYKLLQEFYNSNQNDLVSNYYIDDDFYKYAYYRLKEFDQNYNKTFERTIFCKSTNNNIIKNDNLPQMYYNKDNIYVSVDFEKSYILKVYDSNGNLVLLQNINNEVVNIANFANGVYFVELINKDDISDRIKRKFIK